MDTAVLESMFSLDIFGEIPEPLFEEFDPEFAFHIDGYDAFQEELVLESAGTTPSNVFSKLWNIIKKAVSFIGKMIMKVVNGVRNVFGHGSKKTGNQIAEEAGLKANNNIALPSYADITEEQKKQMDDAVNSMISSMISEVGDDRLTFICPGELVSMDPMDPSIKVKGKAINAAWERATRVIILVKDPSPIRAYKDFFKRVLGNGKSINEADIEAVYTACQQFAGRSSIISYAKDAIAQNIGNEKHGGAVGGKYAKVTIQLQDLIDFQKEVDEICKLGEEFDNYVRALNTSASSTRYRDTDKSKNFHKTYMEILNELAWCCVELQGGLHAIANGLKGVYEVGIQYFNSVDNPNVLANFIEKAIVTGMPGKYVVRNIFNICKENIKGTPNIDKPIMGFGRLTLIPKGEVIYKVAINRYGIRSNKNDFMVLKAIDGIKDPEFKTMFADSVQTYGEYAVNAVEKVQAGTQFEPSRIDAMKLAEIINGRFRREGINFQIYDIKPDAFGQRDGKYVILDYGYTQRISAMSGNEFAKRTQKNPQQPFIKFDTPTPTAPLTDEDKIDQVLSGKNLGNDRSSGVVNIPNVGKFKKA